MTVYIHALREEGDQMAHVLAALMPTFLSTPSARRATGAMATIKKHKIISIHALREEGDLLTVTVQNVPGEFLSTPSARRATGLLQRES